MNYKIKFLRPFKDGNIFPHGFAFDEVITVTPVEYEKLKNSQGSLAGPHLFWEGGARPVSRFLFFYTMSKSNWQHNYYETSAQPLTG